MVRRDRGRRSLFRRFLSLISWRKSVSSVQPIERVHLKGRVSFWPETNILPIIDLREESVDSA